MMISKGGLSNKLVTGNLFGDLEKKNNLKKFPKD